MPGDRGWSSLISCLLSCLEGMSTSPPLLPLGTLQMLLWTTSAKSFLIIAGKEPCMRTLWVFFRWITCWSFSWGERLGYHPPCLLVFPCSAFLQLARLVRLVRLFSSLEYDTRLSLLWVTMARNLSLLAYLINWFACLFQLASRGFGWSHVDVSDFNSLETIFERYLGSLYWAVETLTSPQYGNEAPRTRWELAAATARIGLFMAYDIAIGAYIMGTISLLVVKADERTGQYRDRAANLKQFVQQHAIPSDLRESMQEHLALHFQNEDASDESVLSIYPTTLRRRILRHLYGKYIQESYLFAGARQKFLDALLAACRIELYMPNVDILTDGEAVNELCLLLDGSMEIITTSAATAASQVEGEAAAQAQPLAALPSSRQGSPPPAGAQMAGADPVGLAGGLDGEGSGVTELRPREGDGRKVSRTVSLKRQLGASKEEVLNVRTIGPGCCFGEIAFFTEIPQHEVVRSVSVCRVMVVSRSTYTGIVSSFPLSARSVLSNLQRAVEHTVLAAFPTMKDSESFVSMLRRSPSTLVRHTAGVGLYAGSAAEQDDSAHMNAQDKEWRKLLKGPLSERQAVLVGNLHRTRTLLMEHTSKMDAERVTAFLYACSLGHVQTVRKMLQEGFPPDEADYDGRTGLMLACVNGHEAIARELLVCGADPLRPDAMGTCALLEAVNNGRDALISLLTRAGSRLSYGKGTVMDAVRLCTCVFECDLPKLRRLLKAGCPVDAGDYDLRTALHVCASEGNLALVRMLVEEGQADMHKRDRWGNTPLHEAMHIGAGQVVEYMREQLAGRGLPQDLALLEDTAPTESSRKGQGSSGEGSIRGGQNSNAYREGSVRGGQNFNAYRDHKSDNSIQRPASRRYSLFRRINSSLRSSWKGKAGGYGR
eukprot:jgi/Botrbrau1/18840/Bobra.177_2s0005.1